MATIKLVLRKNYQKKDKTFPIAVRITQDRKTRFVFTGHYILDKDWDTALGKAKKSYPNSAQLNNKLLTELLKAEKTALELDVNEERPVSSKQIQKKLKRQAKTMTLYQVADKRIAEYEAKGTFSVSRADRSIVNNIRKFTKDKELYFEDITTAWIARFKAFCAIERKQSTRTITNQMIFIRTLFNRAINEGYVDRKYYPFGGENETIRIGSGLKIGLTREEIEIIETLELESGTTIWHTRNIWLFAFYLAGIRISDVLQLKWSDFNDGRLMYVMNKNEKPVSLKIPDKGIVILNNYRQDKQGKDDFVFPGLKKANMNDPHDVFVKTRNASRLMNKYLKRIAQQANIDKNLSNHIARHSFGNIAGDKIHPLMLQKLYRHSDLKTTINYQANFIHKDADEALDQVIG